MAPLTTVMPKAVGVGDDFFGYFDGFSAQDMSLGPVDAETYATGEDDVTELEPIDVVGFRLTVMTLLGGGSGGGGDSGLMPI